VLTTPCSRASRCPSSRFSKIEAAGGAEDPPYVLPRLRENRPTSARGSHSRPL
jgi:hypothetical protein